MGDLDDLGEYRENRRSDSEERSRGEAHRRFARHAADRDTFQRVSEKFIANHPRFSRHDNFAAGGFCKETFQRLHLIFSEQLYRVKYIFVACV